MTTLTPNEFISSTTTEDLASLLHMTIAALEGGVSAHDVAQRLRPALRAGFGHVAYAAEALSCDLSDIDG